MPESDVGVRVEPKETKEGERNSREDGVHCIWDTSGEGGKTRVANLHTDWISSVKDATGLLPAGTFNATNGWTPGTVGLLKLA